MHRFIAFNSTVTHEKILTIVKNIDVQKFFLKFSEFCVKTIFLNFSVFLYDFTQNTENFKKNFLDIDIFYNCEYFFMSYRRVNSYEPMHKLMLRFLKNITTFLFFSDRTHIHFFIKNHENA